MRMIPSLLAWLILTISAGAQSGNPPIHSIPVAKSPGTVGWAALGPGTTGQVVIAQGASADPAMRTLSGSCTVISTGVMTCTGGSVATVAALKALTVPATGTVQTIAGYYTAGDGGEGAFTYNSASSATDDGGTVITPNAGGGRWLRQTYSTIPNLQWWGPKCDWNGSSGTDDSAIFGKAATWALSVKGASIMIPRGARCAIASTVAINQPNVSFYAPVSAGEIHTAGSSVTSCGAAIFWGGAANGIMFEYLPNGSGGTSQSLLGGGLKNLCLFGQGIAGYGVLAISIRELIFDHLYIESTTVDGIQVAVAPVYNGGLALGDPCDSQRNRFTNITVNNLSTAGAGILLTGYSNGSTIVCNVSLNTFDNVYVGHNAGEGLIDKGSDNNSFNRMTFLNPGVNHDVDWSCSTDGGSVACTSDEYFFGGLTARDLIARGTVSFPTASPSVTGIWITGLDKSNGTPDPTLETGASVTWIDSTGAAHLSSVTNGSTGLIWSKTAPSAPVFCTSPTFPATNGTAAFTINVGSACGASTGSFTMPSAATGWTCSFVNVTHPATDLPEQTGGAVNSVTLTNYDRTGTPLNFTSSDVIRAMCSGY